MKGIKAISDLAACTDIAPVKRTKKSIHGRNGCVLRKVSDVCRSDKPDND